MRVTSDIHRSRNFGHRGGSSSARPDPGRGNIMPGSRAREIRRRREDRRYVGGRRGPQGPSSLVNRITMDRGGRGGGRGQNHHPVGGRNREHPIPLAQRITGGNVTGRAGAQATAHTPNSGNVNNNRSGLVTARPRPVARSQEPTFTFNPLPGQPVAAPVPVPQARDPVSTTTRTPAVRTSSADKPKPFRVIKNAVDGFTNAKLRAVFSGKKIRPPKVHGGMMLRVAKATHNLQGHELTAASPYHEPLDGDDEEE